MFGFKSPKKDFKKKQTFSAVGFQENLKGFRNFALVLLVLKVSEGFSSQVSVQGKSLSLGFWLKNPKNIFKKKQTFCFQERFRGLQFRFGLFGFKGFRGFSSVTTTNFYKPNRCSD